MAGQSGAEQASPAPEEARGGTSPTHTGATGLGQSASRPALAGRTGLAFDTGEQSIWDCIQQFNMYDPLALVAAIPKLQHVFDFDAFVVNGVTLTLTQL